jgi:tetraacyldisaccharide 4'-kinase
MDLRTWMARRLEQGAPGGPLARLASSAWAVATRIERPLRWRDGAGVIVVGGSTLGGSGKTPLAMACAEVLGRAGAKVALVGHGYCADLGPARFVSPADDVRVVGDEALECARRLAGIPVAVAKTRQRALDLALGVADVAVVDGLCQTRPHRASLSLLAVDATAPWGAGRCPPQGDLRAPAAALLAAADRVVVIGAEGEGRRELRATVPVDHAWVVSRGASLDGRLIGWDDLRGCKVGLWTALARPDRVVRALAKRGVRPAVVILGADHRSSAPPPHIGVDLWLCTPKCAAHLRLGGGAPVAILEHSLRLESALEKATIGAAQGALTHDFRAHTLGYGVT